MCSYLTQKPFDKDTMAISMVLEQDGGSDYVGHTGSDLLCLFKAFG